MGLSQFKMGKFNSLYIGWMWSTLTDENAALFADLHNIRTRQVLLKIWQANTTDADDIVNQMKHSF